MDNLKSVNLESFQNKNNELHDIFKDIAVFEKDTQEVHDLFKDETKKRLGKAYDFNVSEKEIVSFKLLEW